MANGKVKFKIDHVLISMKRASRPMAEKVAFQVEARTKVNIQQNRQIDTGFMLNSTYTQTSNGSTFNSVGQNGELANRKGQQVKRSAVRPRELPGDALAGVAVAANYAIWQEEKKPFLYPACVDAASDSGLKADAQKVFQENLSD